MGSMIATLDLRGGTMAMVPLTQPDVFGTTVSGKCSTPGTSKGAARGCYGQLNDGFIGDGVFFTTAFAAGPPEVVLGVDLKTGQVVFEQGPTDSPVRAALASCPLRCLRNQPCSYGPVQRCCATCPSVVCVAARLLLRTWHLLKLLFWRVRMRCLQGGNLIDMAWAPAAGAERRVEVTAAGRRQR
jgi:hypothetical protein